MPADAPGFAITPETSVGELLEHYPQLEGVLNETYPGFEALKNSTLRRTVAGVATLRRVAEVSAVPLGELIGKLRSAVGLEGAAGGAGESAGGGGRPAWAAASAVTRSFDARAIIESGGHPLPRVMADLARLEPGQVYELVTPFVPAPLIDLAGGKGFAAYSVHESPSLVRTYFTSPSTSPLSAG